MHVMKAFYFLKSVKLEHDYRKAQTMFEEKQESLINHSSLSDCANATKSHEKMEHSIPTSPFNLDIPVGEIYKLPMTSNLNAGIFTNLLKLLEECRPRVNTAVRNHAHGEYVEPLQPHAYKIFQSVLHDIFPWTVTFSKSKSICDTVKVVLSKPNITDGVEIPNWKEITLFLPSKISIATNDVCHFTMQILGNKVDYGELPHIIFHPDIFKSASADDLCVCPGISDPALIDIAERKKQKLSYYVDSCGTIVDRKNC